MIYKIIYIYHICAIFNQLISLADTMTLPPSTPFYSES